MSPEAEPSQDVLTTVRKRLELVINEIDDAEVIAMLRTAMSELDLVLAQSDAEPVCPRCGGRGSHMHPKTAWEDRLDFAPLRAEPVAWHSTPAMRARIRELARPNSDDYDRAVIAVLDDFEAALVQSEAKPVAWPDIDAAVKAGLARRNPAPDAAPSAHSNTKTVTIGNNAPPRPDASAGRVAELKREIYTLRANLVECADTLSAQQFNQTQQERIEACRVELAALSQSYAEPVAWKLVPIEPTPAMLKRGDQGQTPEYIWEAMLYAAPAPPRPDASAGLIEAAEMAEEYASKYCYDSQAEQGLLCNFAQFLRSRAADRSGK